MNTEQDISPLVNTNEVPTKNPESRATLRDTFAAAALQGLVASNFYDRWKESCESESEGEPIPIGEPAPIAAASIAYEYADAMMALREVIDL